MIHPLAYAVIISASLRKLVVSIRGETQDCCLEEGRSSSPIRSLATTGLAFSAYALILMYLKYVRAFHLLAQRLNLTKRNE